MAELTEPDQKSEVAQLPEKKVDDIIFPGNSTQEKHTESIKFRFGSFAATKN